MNRHDGHHGLVGWFHTWDGVHNLVLWKGFEMMKDKLISAEVLLNALRDDISINGTNFAKVRRHIEDAPAVENEELQFTRQFIHEHGLEFTLASAWQRRKEDGK